jgi:hypothetical protein
VAERPAALDHADVMMGIAVAEESGFYLGAAIGFVETDDVHIEIHRPIEVRDHQIDVAEPSRLKKFCRLIDSRFQFNDVHGSAPDFRLRDAGTLGLTDSWFNMFSRDFPYGTLRTNRA